MSVAAGAGHGSSSCGRPASKRAGGFDVYRTAKEGAAFGVASSVLGVNGPTTDGNPLVSKDELTIYFIAGTTLRDIYMATGADALDVTVVDAQPGQRGPGGGIPGCTAVTAVSGGARGHLR